MSLQPPPIRHLAKRPMTILLLLFILNLGVMAQMTEVASAEHSGSESGMVTMNFHMYSSVYGNSKSVFIYNGADMNPPTYATPVTTVVSCSSSALELQQFLPQTAQTWFAGMNAWFGGVSWVTQPLAEDMTIRGNVSMNVWMSAIDADPAASGYTFGMSEVDGMMSVVGEPMYGYDYTSGSALGSSPRLHQLTLNVDRTFAKGHLIAFFVGVGSTSEGWRFQVYFDSASMNSFAALPVFGMAIPEFSQVGIWASMTLAVLCYLAIRRRTST